MTVRYIDGNSLQDQELSMQDFYKMISYMKGQEKSIETILPIEDLKSLLYKGTHLANIRIEKDDDGIDMACDCGCILSSKGQRIFKVIIFADNELFKYKYSSILNELTKSNISWKYCCEKIAKY